MTEIATMDVGPYALLTQVGAGRDGSTFLGRDRRDGSVVEVRLLDRARDDAGRWGELCRRLRAVTLTAHGALRRPVEAQQLQLDHDPPYLVLPRVEAGPLAEAIGDAIPLGLAEAVALGLELASALADAHRLGLAHGRLGPREVRLTASRAPVLDLTGLDVGDAPGPHLTDPLAELEASCLAPECRDGHPPSEPADVFALGALIHWTITGQPPDPTAAVGSMHETIVLGESGAPALGSGSGPDALRALDDLVRAMLLPDPASRPTAREVARRLGALANALAAADTWGDHAASQTARIDGESTFLDAESRAPAALLAAEPGSARRALEAERRDLALGDRLGRYVLLEKLGQGGMGAVFRAEDLTDGTVVAIKVLRPELASRPESFRRFCKEARLLAEVRSPYVANLLEVNDDDGIHFLALQYVRGRSLGKLLADRGKLDEPTALAIAADVCRALADAHDRGIVHRDIKPENILLEESDAPDPDAPGSATPRVRLSDFGLARHVVETQSLQLTADHAVIGTPNYMAPEQCAGNPVDTRSDVYSIGVTLFHMLAGRPPFEGRTLIEVISRHCTELPPALRALDPAISDATSHLVERALSKEPEARFADASALLEEIERIRRGEPARIAAHPVLPVIDPARVLDFDFTWDLRASPRQLWPLVTNTERLNHAVGLPAVSFSTQLDREEGRVRRYGVARQGGLSAIWEEHPFEWIEPRRMGVLREYRKGPFRWMTSVVELTPRPGGGTTLAHRLRIEPRGTLMRAAARIKVGGEMKRALERVYRRIDESLSGELSGDALADPFEAVPPLPMPRRRKLDRLLDALVRDGVNPGVVERLGEFLASAPSQEVARIRPLALARRLGLDPDQVVAACLHGAREGLLVLLWDILCPVCRIPSEIQGTLKALREHGRCDACNLDFELDFARSVEMIFRAHPEVRDTDLGTYCIGGPAHSPHVVAQVRLAPGETFALELGLSEGTYRLRGPQLGFDFEFRVEPSLGAGRLDVDLARGPSDDSPRAFRAGAQTFWLTNPTEHERVARVERTAPRADALTAARASTLALFRDLFPGEILSAGQLISIAATTLLMAEPDGAERLYESLGDARAFAVLSEQFRLVDERVRREGGALVKTLGEGVMAAFPDAPSAVRAALALPADLLGCEATRGIVPRVAVHRGPAMAATINDHLDYFGLTVGQAARLLIEAGGGEMVLSQAVAGEPAVAAVLRARGLEDRVFQADLPGQPGALLHRVHIPRP